MIGLPERLAPRLPFYYGWIVLACVCCAGFARQGPAVATLSIFMTPMTETFGWSRTAMSGAVSVGGLAAALLSPVLGPLMDRHGSRMMLCGAVLVTGLCALSLSWVATLPMFYLLYCTARMNFAGPFDLGIYGAINTWFLRRRALATSTATLAQMSGLVAMPLIAQFAISGGTVSGGGGWPDGWLAVGTTVLVVGFLPAWLLMRRSPEDMGLLPDGDRKPLPGDASDQSSGQSSGPIMEPSFTRAQAMRTPAFWLLSLFTLLVYPVQAGVSLHQAPHLIERGLDPTLSATIVSTFSLMSAIAGFGFGWIARRLAPNHSLALVGAALCGSTLAMIWIEGPWLAYLSAAGFGVGIGGLLTLLPIAWADYFGRRSFGAIRGAALTVQVTAQAMGPILSGVLWDLTGDYVLSLSCFGGLAGAAALTALFLRTPKPVDAGTVGDRS